MKIRNRRYLLLGILFSLWLVFLFGCTTPPPTPSLLPSPLAKSETLPVIGDPDSPNLPFTPTVTFIPTATASSTVRATPLHLKPRTPGTATPILDTRTPIPTYAKPTVTPQQFAPTPLPDFNALAIISLSNVTRLQKLAQFYPVTEGMVRYPRFIEISPTGRYLAYVDESVGRVKLWGITQQQIIRVFAVDPTDKPSRCCQEAGCHGMYPEDCSISQVGPVFSPDEKLIAVVDLDGPQVWEVATGKMVLRSVPVHDQWGNWDKRYEQEYGEIAFSPDGRKIFTGAYFWNASLTVWDVSTGKVIEFLPPHEGGYVHGFTFSVDNRFMFSLGRGPHVMVRDPFTGHEIENRLGCYPSDTCADYKGWLCGVGFDMVGIAVTPNGEILSVACSPEWAEEQMDDGCDTDMSTLDEINRINQRGTCGDITIYDTQTWQSIGDLDYTPHKMGGISFNHDGGLMAFGTDQPEKAIELWSTLGRQRVHRLDGFSPLANGPYNIHFSPDGHLLVFQFSDGEVQIWGVVR